MSKSASESKDSKVDKSEKKESLTQTATTKLAVFEEDDYFEEFDDEEWVENNTNEDIDFKQWQEDWEDEEINDQFDKVLSREMELAHGNIIAK